jgi:exodeoxyribonuclease V alpha subunit
MCFTFCENWHLPYRFIIIDEASMLDIDLLASLLRACGPETHILFVGDPNQLLPVGHGAPLRDILAAGVPQGELEEIHRNAGTIERVCKAIRGGQPWQTDATLDASAGRNLKLLTANDTEVATQKIIDTLRAIERHKLADPIWDCQVIVAVNKGSGMGRRALNACLQAELNHSQKIVGSPFRLWDKIICLKNGFMPVDEAVADEIDGEPTEDGRVYVANGEIGRIVGGTADLLCATFDAPRRSILIPRGNGDGEEGKTDAIDTGCNFDLAYAISGHKGQGSEFPVTFVVLDDYPGARMVCSREWIYTAISRAKKACFLVGKKSTADMMCLRREITKRKTFLRELIKNEQ